jgi:hypothetical protein
MAAVSGVELSQILPLFRVTKRYLEEGEGGGERADAKNYLSQLYNTFLECDYSLLKFCEDI